MAMESSSSSSMGGPIATLRRLQQDAFQDIMALRGRLNKTERDVEDLERWRAGMPSVSVDAASVLGVCVAAGRSAAGRTSSDDDDGNDAGEMVEGGGKKRRRFAPVVWHKTWISTVVQNATAGLLNSVTASQADGGGGGEVRVRCASDGDALALRSVEVFVPTAVDRVKVKLIPIAHSGHCATTGIGERGIGALCDDFVTPAGASASLPFLDHVQGHGVAVGVNALNKKLMITAASFIDSRAQTSIRAMHSTDQKQPTRMESNVPRVVPATSAPRRRDRSGGGGRGALLNSAHEASQHMHAIQEGGIHEEALDVRQQACVIAEAAMLLSPKVALGVVGLRNSGRGTGVASSSSGSRGDSNAHNCIDNRAYKYALGAHGLAFFMDSFCLRGWFAREGRDVLCRRNFCSANPTSAVLHADETTRNAAGTRKFSHSFGLSLTSLSAYDDSRVSVAFGSSPLLRNGEFGTRRRASKDDDGGDGSGTGGLGAFAARNGLYGEASMVVPLDRNIRIVPNLTVSFDDGGKPTAAFFARARFSM